MGTDVEVPSYFRCPISMELMRDPVTVSTGMTYDRQSIEHWVYTCKKRTCPATMQELQNLEFTPNHTLRRLIQGWCVVNSSKGVDRIPTPKSPVDPMQVADLLQQAARSKPAQAVHALKKLRFLAKESERNLRCIGSVGPGPVLISLLGSCYREEIWNSSLESQSLLSSYCREEIENENSRIWEEALGVLHLLPATQDTAKLLSEPAAMRSLALILQRGSSEARLHAVILLQNVAERILDWEPVVRQNNDVLHRLVEMLRDEFCHQATIAALDVIKAMCMHSRRNKLKAVEAGLVFVLIELLPEAEGIKVEKILELLDKLSDCAEGRAAVASHAMGVAAVSKMIMRMSEFATRKAVRILWSLCIFSPSAAVLRDMLQFGGASKLCVLLQIECTRKTKQKAKDILKLHGKTWCSSPCFPSSFRLFFPDLQVTR